jgi:hypothetical protein
MRTQEFCLDLLRRASVPLVLVNALVGAAGIAWVAARGDWVLVLVALLLLFPAVWLLRFLLAPAHRLAEPLQRLAEEEKRIPVALFAFLQTFYGFVLVTGWCASVFALALGGIRHSGSDLPVVLLAYGFASAPWSWHASKELSEARETTLGALASQIAGFALVVAIGLFHLPIEKAYFVLGAVMLPAFVGATLLMLLVWMDFIERCEPSDL